MRNKIGILIEQVEVPYATGILMESGLSDFQDSAICPLPLAFLSFGRKGPTLVVLHGLFVQS